MRCDWVVLLMRLAFAGNYVAANFWAIRDEHGRLRSLGTIVTAADTGWSAYREMGRVSTTLFSMTSHAAS